LKEWENHRGIYAANGVVLSIIRESSQAEDHVPDLFIFGLPGYFRGYYKGYSCDLQNGKMPDGSKHEDKRHNRFTWVILKGRTRSHQGFVELKDTNPLSRPKINFRYFDDPQDPKNEWQKDLRALVEGVRFAYWIMMAADPHAADPKAAGSKWETIVPPPDKVNLTNDDQLADFIKREAWGHHACGTCRIGGVKDDMAVLDGDFRVRGVENLRVVDASVFPKIPGLFIVTSIYMISEKAAKVILNDMMLKRQNKPLKLWPPPPVPKG
jgi:choline dehydrogenase